MKQNIDRLLKSLWIRACRVENVPADTKFVAFSADNTYMIRHNKVMIIKQAGYKELLKHEN